MKENKDLSTVNSFILNKNSNIVHACKINKCVEKKIRKLNAYIYVCKY